MERNHIYPGINPYDESGLFEFAGRHEETWALFDRIVRNEYTVYYAASGEGKSSLIRAGLLPILMRRDYFPIYIVLEDSELKDVASIDKIIDRRIANVLNSKEAVRLGISYGPSDLAKSLYGPDELEELSKNTWWKLRNYCFKRGEKELKSLFIFDQFEEVFTKVGYDWTDSFFNWLELISTDYVPDSLKEIAKRKDLEIPTQKNFKALFSLRTEYLGELDYWCVQKHFIPSLQENRMCLKPLTVKGAQEVINLNRDALEKYSVKIIQGCSEEKTDGSNPEQPCVYALILSVVCKTLSEMPDNDRLALLDRLNDNQEETINEIILKFYHQKLKEAGLDHTKNENIIASLEDAFVDEKGKRSRRDTDEKSIRPILKWVEKLTEKEIGLIKVVGEKKIDDQTVKTVEFPHDRLCKAIDSSRKERQGKLAWKLNRQSQWVQFGIITVICGIIAFLWNNLMPALNAVIEGVLYSDVHIVKTYFENFISLKWIPSVLNGDVQLDEGFSILSLMVSMLLFIPFITIFITRKTMKGQLTSAIVSLLSLLSFLFLCYKNLNISFSDGYVSLFAYFGLIGSAVSLAVSVIRLRGIRNKGEIIDSERSDFSTWPLWGGYLLFSFYLFYEFLFRITFGINEPYESCWALSVIPLLYTLWAYGFFNIKVCKGYKRSVLLFYLFSIVFLILLSILSVIPSNIQFKQTYGFTLSLLLIGLWIIAGVYIVVHSQSKSKFYIFSNAKRFLVILLGSILIIATFILNLGYNPLVIKPSSVSHVSSWRDVTVFEDSEKSGRRFGLLYATDGDTIVPVCIPADVRTESIVSRCYNGLHGITLTVPFGSSPFISKSDLSNNDRSIRWDSINKIRTFTIPSTSTLEQHLHNTLKGNSSRPLSHIDSVEYYAAKLFKELRAANLRFALSDSLYGLDALKSFDTLDSLQSISLNRELSTFSMTAQDTTFTSGGRPMVRQTIDVLQDKHLVDFHKELARSFLLCLIKDRALHKDMPSMFTLSTTYMMAYFPDVPLMGMTYEYTGSIDMNMQFINGKDSVSSHFKCKIDTSDILNKKLFAWYALFNGLCITDMGWNSIGLATFFNEGNDNIKQFYEFEKELKSNLSAFTLTNILDKSADYVNHPELLNNVLRKFKEGRDPKTYEEWLGRLDKLSLSLNTLEVDRSLRTIKDSVFEKLIPIMINNPRGIYNNDFENICKNLLMVSAFRGNDIENDAAKLSEYFKVKNKLYDFTALTQTNKAIGTIAQGKREVEEQLKKLVSVLKGETKSR